MRVFFSVIATAFFFAAGLSQTPQCSGKITVGEDTLTPEYAIGVWGESTATWEKGKKLLRVFVANSPFSEDGVLQALTPEDAIRAQIQGSYGILALNTDGTVNDVYVYIDSGSKNYGFRGSTKTEIKTMDQKTVSGRVSTESPQSIGETPLEFDLSFDAAVIPKRTGGKKLAKDGGDAGAAYLAYVAAQQNGDMEKLIQYAASDRAAFLKDMDADYAQYEIDNVKDNAPKSAEVLGGEGYGDFAILFVKGTDTYGDAFEGKVKMVRDGQSWRFAEEDLKTVW